MNVDRLSGTASDHWNSEKLVLCRAHYKTTYTTSSAFGIGMGRTLGSALTLSTIGLGSKLVVNWLAKKFDVRGLPILLNALKEPDLQLSWKKGKGKLVDNVQEKPRSKRRGIVTSECQGVS